MYKNLKVSIAISIVVCSIVISIITACYSMSHNGGWYCEYCHQGSIRGKYEVEHEFGNKPCMCSDDSCHHFKYYITQPIEKPKYIK